MKIKNDYVLQQIADEYVVVPVGEEAERLHGVIRLNDTGAYLWKTITKVDSTVDELIKCIVQEYGVDKSRAYNDVTSFVLQLEQIGCLDK